MKTEAKMVNDSAGDARIKKLILIVSAVGLLLFILFINPLTVQTFFSKDHKLNVDSFYSLLVLSIFTFILLLFYIFNLFLIRKGKPRLPNFTANITLAVFILLVGLFFLEILFRTVLSPMVPKKLYAYNQFFGMQWHKPNLDMRLKTSEYDINFRTNSIGIRADTELRGKTDNEKRIIVLGDSFVQAAQVNLEDTMCQLLEEKLNASVEGNAFRVFNLGTSGCDPAYQRKFLEKNLKYFQGDHLLLFLYIGNDIITPEAFLERGDRGVNKILDSLIGMLKNHSYLLTFIHERMIKKGYPLGRPCQPFDGEPKERSTNIFLKEYTEKIEAAYLNLWKELLKIRDIARENGMQLTIVVIPTKEQVDSSKLAEVIDFFKIGREQIDLTKPQRLIGKFLSQNQIDFFDLLEPLSVAAKVQKLYFDLDSHWNVNGNRIMADLVFNRFIEIFSPTEFTLKGESE
jgi:hypothetical protein